MAKRLRSWLVEFDSDAVIDFEDDLGPDLPSPHMKSLKGEADLFELRPKQGACEARPIYGRLDGRFVVLSVAAKKKDFERAVVEAAERLKHYR